MLDTIAEMDGLIDFEQRHVRQLVGNICLITVDGTDKLIDNDVVAIIKLVKL